MSKIKVIVHKCFNDDKNLFWVSSDPFGHRSIQGSPSSTTNERKMVVRYGLEVKSISSQKGLAVKVGGLKKKSANRPWPHSNQSARIRVRAGSNHSHSLMAGNFAVL